MTTCRCKDWQPNIDKINTALDLQRIHGKDYDGKFFKYCPWCGSRLKKVKEVRKNDN